MQLSVIILNYNVRYFLEQCLCSVQKALQGIDGEIIVVDNNSADDSCAMVRENFPGVTLIENNYNAGFPKGNNIGVQAAKGKYICILNPDTVIAEDTFAKVMEFARQQQTPGITGIKMIDGGGHFLPESKRGVPTPWVAFTKIAGLGKMFSQSQFFNKYYACHLKKNNSGKVDILAGAFMFMERDLYLSVGGFDEGCFMYSDDIDLSYTVLKEGRDNYYFAGSSIIHYKGESTVRDGEYMSRFRQAMQFFYKKHFRSSPVFNVFMKSGALFFALVKKNKKVPGIVPDEYLLFSADEMLKEKLEEISQKKVIRLGEYRQNMLFSHKEAGSPKIEVVFDSALLDYCDIIAIMEQHANDGYTFKIKPEGCNYIIGSNNSNDRGEVILL
jgi:GT2 family glycosyltransferase